MDATEAPEAIDLTDIPPLDIATLTMGEMAEAETQSGRDFAKLLTAGSATRKLLAMWVHEYRHSEKPRSWRALSDLRAFARKS